jgi:hypothetical protein
MSPLTRIALGAILLALSATAAHAESDVWAWQDAQGKWHYSDVPVQGAKLVRKGSRSAPAAAAPATAAAAPKGGAASATAAGDAASARLAAEAAARGVQADLDKNRAEQCKQASERYDKMIAARRLYKEPSPGQRAYLSDAELAQARVDARRERDEACGSAPR